MTTEQRYVFDTNVLVSALLFPHSTPQQAFDRACVSGMLLTSVATAIYWNSARFAASPFSHHAIFSIFRRDVPFF